MPKAVGKYIAQMDERWSFVDNVDNKGNKQWVWLAMDVISRLVRKTLSFSKKLENHIAAIWNFIHDYNYQIRVEMLKALLPEFSPPFT